MDPDSKFYISQDDFDTVIAYAQSAYDQFKSEIGGQMIILQDEEGDYILQNPVILKQTISSSECTLELESLVEHYGKMAAKYGTKARNCWWHSHHTMKAFWSPQDNETIMASKAKDWSVSLVVNLKREYKLRIQFFSPFEHEVNVELNILREKNVDTKSIDDEVKKLCKKEQPVATYQNNKYGHQQQFYYGGSMYTYPTRKQGDREIYNTYLAKTVTLNDTVNEQIYDNIIDNIDKATEEMENLIHLNKTKSLVQYWNKYRQETNEQLKKYNLELIKFKDASEIECALIQCISDDYLDNIVKERTV